MNLSLILVKFYRSLSPWFRNNQVFGITYTNCKFYPSCSEFAEMALCKHGQIKGSVKIIQRLFKCHPFAKGGIDYP